MDKVIRVNIGGISFSLEDKAYQIIESYLDELGGHYRANVNGKEIMDGIEERMAELLIDRGGKTSVISQSIAKEVTDILGRPEEIDSADGEKSVPKGNTQKKRFYRNPGDKIVGGVFGGIAAYFHIDTIWLRLGFVALLFSAWFTDFGWWNPGTLLLIYAVLWICIPIARTTEQRCEMCGETLSYDNIERKMENRREYDTYNRSGSQFWSILGKCLLIIPGAILLITGLAGFLGILAAVFGVAVAGMALPVALNEAFTFTSLSPAWMTACKVLLGLVITLPFIGMLYGGISLLFKLKTPKWRPGLWIFIIWALSLIAVAVLGVKCTKHFLNRDHPVTNSVISPAGDTIHIEFAELEKWKDKQVLVNGDEEEYNLMYIDTENYDSVSVAVYPLVRLQHSESQECKITVSSNLLSSTMTLEEMNKKRELGFYRFENDTLTLEASVFGSGRDMQEIGRKITITVPDEKSVTIEHPIFHQFQNEFEYSNMDISANRIKEIEKILRRFDIDIDLDDFAEGD